jgi:hypothetical protein
MNFKHSNYIDRYLSVRTVACERPFITYFGWLDRQKVAVPNTIIRIQLVLSTVMNIKASKPELKKKLRFISKNNIPQNTFRFMKFIIKYLDNVFTMPKALLFYQVLHFSLD